MDVFTLKGTISVDATDAKNDIDAVKKAAEEAKTALDNLKAAANNAEGELDQVATAANNAETELEGLKTASSSAETELDELKTAADNAADELEDVETQARNAKDELNKLDTAADDAADELGDIDTQGNKAKTALQHVGTYAVTAGKNLDDGSGFSVGAHYAANLLWELSERAAEFVWELGKMGMDFNASMETWSLQLTTLLGADDIEVGKAFLEEIRQFAIDTPLALDQAVQSAVGLLASGINSEDVIDTLWMLGDIAMGDTEKLSRIALVYSQIMAGGKMQGDDLRQFKNAGVPIYDLLEQYYEAMDAGTDYTEAMLADMQKEGEITAEDVHGALLMATQEGGMFYNAMAAMMEGYEGQTEKFKDTTQQTMGELTASFFELMKSEGLPKLTQLMNDLMQWAKENPEVIEKLSKALSDLAVGGLTLVTDSLKSLLEYWTTHREEFNSLLILFGGMAFSAGHPLAGAALITVGGYDVWNQLKETGEDIYEDSMSPEKGKNSNPVRWALRDDVEAKLDSGVAYEDLTEEEKGEVAKAKAVAGAEQRVVDLHDNTPLGKSALAKEWLEEKKATAVAGVVNPEEYGLKLSPAYMAELDKLASVPPGEVLANINEYIPDVLARWYYHNHVAKFQDMSNEELNEVFETYMIEMFPNYKDAPQSKKDLWKMTVTNPLLDYYDLPGSGGGGNPYDFPAPTSSADTATLIAAIQGLAQAYNPDAIAAAVEGAIIRGMSGVTIEQGNVVLNTGSLVGTLTPILNQKFGALLGRASRG